VEVKDLFERISTRGDIAAAALGYVMGYLGGTYRSLFGLPPGTVALLCAIGLIGVKNLIHSLYPARNQVELVDPVLLEARANSLGRYINQIVDRSATPNLHPLTPIVKEFDQQVEAWRSGVIRDDEFANYLERVASAARPHSQAGKVLQR